MTRVSDEHLDVLIRGLEAYAKEGVYDPWYLAGGAVVQPLDVLRELRAAREQYPDLRPPQPHCRACECPEGYVEHASIKNQCANCKHIL